MTVSPAFKWIATILASFALVLVVADRFGWVDKLAISGQNAEVVTEASNADGFVEQLLTQVENIFPRLFPGTTDLTEAIKNYENSRNLARRTELAYDLIALKFRHDLRDKIPLTTDQEKVYQHALSHIKWTLDLMAFYLAKVPNNQIGTISIKLGDSDYTIQPSIAKRILSAGFSPKPDQCTDLHFADMRENFPDEFLAMNLINLMRIFLILQVQIEQRLIDSVKAPLIASAQSAIDREVMEAIFKIRTTFKSGSGTNTPREIETLNAFFNNKNKDLAFNVFAIAPGCFKSPGLGDFMKLVKKLQSEVRAKFYLDLIRADYKKTHRPPEDLYDFRIENPQNEREEFYRSPSDGWGSQFEMKIDGNQIRLISIGADGKAGTGDDFIAAEGELNETH